MLQGQSLGGTQGIRVIEIGTERVQLASQPVHQHSVVAIPNPFPTTLFISSIPSSYLLSVHKTKLIELADIDEIDVK